MEVPIRSPAPPMQLKVIRAKREKKKRGGPTNIVNNMASVANLGFTMTKPCILDIRLRRFSADFSSSNDGNDSTIDLASLAIPTTTLSKVEDIVLLGGSTCGQVEDRLVEVPIVGIASVQATTCDARK
jgi:hypothetical protein